jgi:hypothetical protein
MSPARAAIGRRLQKTPPGEGQQSNFAFERKY